MPAPQQNKRPTLTFRPSKKARERIENIQEQYDSKRSRVIMLVLDWAFLDENQEALQKYLEQQRKCLNPLLQPPSAEETKPPCE